MTRAALVLVAILAALGSAGAVRAAPPSHYPLDLDVAVGDAYKGTLTGIDRTCTVWLSGGREEYALAAVTLRGGRRDVAAFQFINTAGWFDMWRRHAPTAGVPASQRARVRSLVQRIAVACGAKWLP